MARKKTRLQRKREKESLNQAVKYLFLIFLTLFLIIKFGLPGLIRMAGFIGNIRSSSQPIEKQNAMPPQTPVLNPLPEATSSAEINIYGFGEAGTTAQLYVRGITISDSMINNEGEFEFLAVHLREGENEIFVKARDDQENISQESVSYIIKLDKSAPELTVESPKDGDEFFDNDSPITVSGSSEKEATIRVNNHMVINNNGSFETKLELKDGDNQIDVEVVDKAGNKTLKTITVNYTP